MCKKFLSAIILVFAFLFLSIGFNNANINAEELPEEVMANAGRGDKYWAVVNFGADYISDNKITIDIQKEAIANEEVKIIGISETMNASDAVFYKKNEDVQFSSRIEYILKNTDYKEKYVVIFLLREFSFGQLDGAIVDKIFVQINQKRNIDDLDSSDILVTQENEYDNRSADILVTLNPDTIEGDVSDYVLSKVKYKVANDEDAQYMSAIDEGNNLFSFAVYKNEIYDIVVEDVFGKTVSTTFTVSGLVSPEIFIEVVREYEGPIKHSYVMDVEVYSYEENQRGDKLSSADLDILEYNFDEGTFVSIREQMQIVVDRNGIYVIRAVSAGREAELTVVIDNIDLEKPFVEVLNNMVVYTESLEFFNPRNEIFYYDNMSEAENINVELVYYTVKADGTINDIISRPAGTTDEEYLDIVREYLNTVRDVIIRYTVTDEAGWDVSQDSYVKVMDNTPPSISWSANRIGLYINDPYPSKAEIEEAYGLVVNDNSLYPGSDRVMDYRLDFSDLPVDDNNKLNKLGEYRIFVRAVDESGNMSEEFVFQAEVRRRLITIEAGKIIQGEDGEYVLDPQSLYSVYGDKIDNYSEYIGYHCVTRDGKYVPCDQELLEGDLIAGELYVLNPYYSKIYTIFYESIRIPSDLYYLEYGDISEFEIKKRTILLDVHNQQKDYLDPDPELTYEIKDVCSYVPEEGEINPYIDYRCSLLEDDSFINSLHRETGEDVLYDDTGLIILSRKITRCDENGERCLNVLEKADGGVVGGNYNLIVPEAEFTIYPKEVIAYIDDKEKIYGEFDPVYTLRGCTGKPPVNTYSPEYCMSEVGITLYREIAGETVVLDGSGNYVDYYNIAGKWVNRNYVVKFNNDLYTSYLTILKRDVEISVKGDLDEGGNYTGKYTIFYEDDLPNVEIYDSSTGEYKGLAKNDLLYINDSFFYGEAAIYDSEDMLIGEYVDGKGLYKIKQGTISIVRSDDPTIDTAYNYNINFVEGVLEVLQKDIWIEIIRDLEKTYGDDDAKFDESHLDEDDLHIILEANGRYIIKISPTKLEGGEPYIPRDHEEMKYHINREEGIYVGEYNVFLEATEGCENYNVELIKEYKYKINEKDLHINIHDQQVVYKGIPETFTYDYLPEDLPYDDIMAGSPMVEEYRHVGEYKIMAGDLKVVDPSGNDVSFNYIFNVTDGILTIYQREVVIRPTKEYNKIYGDNDPEFEIEVYYNGVKEDIASDDYEGELGREKGEIPDRNYLLNIGTFKIASHVNINNNTVQNYNVTYDFGKSWLHINRRPITITAKSYSIMYGENYLDENKLKIDTQGQLAYNPLLSMSNDETDYIDDIVESGFEILEEVDGVGTYTITARNMKIIRRKTREDVTHYYDFTYTDGQLVINPREIIVTPDSDQSKVYGETDTNGHITYTCKFKDGSPMDCVNDLVDPSDEKWFGGLQRKANIINGVEVTEDWGTYRIINTDDKNSEKRLRVVSTRSGKENYIITINGSIDYIIHRRPIHIKANDLTLEYGDDMELTYTVEETTPGRGLAYNESLGIYDKDVGVQLSLIISGYNGNSGTYTIMVDENSIVIPNSHNYEVSTSTGILNMKKKIVYITPKEGDLHKVYGEKDPGKEGDDPLQIDFDMDPIVEYSGTLVREAGENAKKYSIIYDSLKLGENYVLQPTGEYYFTIHPKVIKVIADNTSKMYKAIDPPLTYTVVGEMVGEDKLMGSLQREPGEAVGQYVINQGTLNKEGYFNPNYTVDYTSGIFTIEYAEFKEIIIYSRTNNPYQILGSTDEVHLYAEFNEGADDSHLKDIVWTIVKDDTIDLMNIQGFVTIDEDNEIHFDPTNLNNPLGVYKVTASYGGISGSYYVFVEKSTVGNVYIEHHSGLVNQTHRDEEPITYKVLVPPITSPNATVQWIVNDTIIQTNQVSNIYFTYTPNSGPMTYSVQAKIGNVISNTLYFYVHKNNPPVIKLENPVIYIEAGPGAVYTEEGAIVVDDFDGVITDYTITGTVDVTKLGTYYIKYDARDSDGNDAVSVYRHVTVGDRTAPKITLIGDSEITLMIGEEFHDPGVTAYDSFEGEVSWTSTNTIQYGVVGTYEVIYTAKDSTGNKGTAVRKVIIMDNVSPVITLNGDDTIYVEVYTKFHDPGAMVYDNADGTFPIEGTSFFYKESVDKEEIQVDKVDTSKLGYYSIHYDYTDKSGNKAGGKVRTVRVEDNTAPIIVLNGTNPYIIRYAYPNVNYKEPGARAIDNYDEYVEVIISGEVGSELGTYYVYYDAVDSNNNIAARVTREVTVVDIERPIIHFHDACPQEITLEALYEEYDRRCDMPGYGVWVEDDYKEDLVEIQKRIVVTGSVDSTTKGTYVIKYDVLDMAGNPAITARRYVTVVDRIAPTIKLLGGDKNGTQIVEVFEDYEELGVEIYDRYDLYHGIEIKVEVSHNVNSMRLGEYLVTYRAKDSSGNEAEPVSRTVYVKDTTPPVITLIGDAHIIVERGVEYKDPGATAEDNYDGKLDDRNIKPINIPTGMHRNKYTIVYTIKDSSGNVGRAERIVEVVDTIPPIVLGVEDGKYYKEPVSIHFFPTLNTDEVLTGWLNGELITSPHYINEEGIYELLVKDDAGNKTEIWFSIDTTPPEILGVTNREYTNRETVEIYSNEKIKYYSYRYNGGEWITSLEQKVVVKEEGTYEIFAVDMADNIAKAIRFVVDRTMPSYSLSGVINKGITNTDVYLTAENNTSIVVNSSYNINSPYVFKEEGYYQVAIRDLAGNTVYLQFVINKDKNVTVNDKLIGILSQHDAIDKISISGSYPRNSGYMLVIPKLEGGFEYVRGKLFSETEYQELLAGKSIEFGVSPSDDTFMYVGFVVDGDELNKFETQTVDDEEEEDNGGLYVVMIFIVLALILFLFIFFIKRRKREEEDEDVEETTYDDYY